MGAPKHPPETRQAYWAFREMGWTRKAAADRVGISVRTADTWESGEPTSADAQREVALQMRLPRPRPETRLRGRPREALEDFALFRRRYLGRVATPWQQEAAHNFLGWLLSPDTEYVIVNCPPGSGKSTLFTMDVPLWLICRDRTFRGFIGHRTAPKAAQYVGRMRRALELTYPLKANPGVGRPFDAEACLGRDYGRFKPLHPGLPWRADEFTVEQLFIRALEDKEPTVMSAGMETEFLGIRSSYVVWDDLVTSRILKNPERVEDQRLWYETEAETRVEPGGLLVLCGQRMGANDLYAHCREMEMVDEDGNATDRKYRHISYPVHFEDRCRQEHSPRQARSYPEGCILDVTKYHWSGRGGIATIRHNREEKYRVQYQQEDMDPASVLVPMLWIAGGTDPETREHFGGCWDTDRSAGTVPRGLVPPVYSVATADPSPSKFWAIQWWLYHEPSNQRFLIDQLRQAMDAPDFLDWNENMRCFYGIVEEWQQRSVALGYPITAWIIESNAAQRFLLQYDHVHRWQRRNGVQIIGHQTHVHNKSSETFGIQMLKNLYRFGQVRLPGNQGDGSREKSLKLVGEATTYPESQTDDCLMAQWFLEFNLGGIVAQQQIDAEEDLTLWRPSWLRSSA